MLRSRHRNAREMLPHGEGSSCHPWRAAPFDYIHRCPTSQPRAAEECREQLMDHLQVDRLREVIIEARPARPDSIFLTTVAGKRNEARSSQARHRAHARRDLVAVYSRHVDIQQHRNGKEDRKSTRLNSSHSQISYAVFCLKKKMISAEIL